MPPRFTSISPTRFLDHKILSMFVSFYLILLRTILIERSGISKSWTETRRWGLNRDCGASISMTFRRGRLAATRSIRRHPYCLERTAQTRLNADSLPRRLESTETMGQTVEAAYIHFIFGFPPSGLALVAAHPGSCHPALHSLADRSHSRFHSCSWTP